MSKTTLFFAITAIAAGAFNLRPAAADEAQVARGKYLVRIAGCNDCHTPGYFFGKPDASRYLSGSEVAFEIPGVGSFAGSNLTPDKETGLGAWTAQQIVTTFTTGVRPDGRVLAPVMPFASFAQLTKEDALAIAMFLKSLPPIKNKVPGPFIGGQKPTTFVFRMIPPEKPTARN
jgi:mono/diheme cytochrome c family protein